MLSDDAADAGADAAIRCGPMTTREQSRGCAGFQRIGTGRAAQSTQVSRTISNWMRLALEHVETDQGTAGP